MIKIKKNHDLGMLLLRLAVGGAFIAHGWVKFSNMEMTLAFFASLGIPAVLAYLVAAIEFLGGAALVIGIWTDLAALLLAIIMVVALVYVKMVKFQMGFFTPGGWELDLIMLASCLAILFVGPGKHQVKGR